MIKHSEINDIIVTKKEDAEQVVSLLKEIIKKYTTASLADLYDLVGLPTNSSDTKWVWKILNDVPIRETEHGYVIELPPLEEI
jgi:hypothetical protein